MHTIVACSTPPGQSGIAIVRLSGSTVKKIIQKISQKNVPPAKTPTLLSLYDNKKVFDQAIITYYKKGHSYTGEDLIEISCHGNPVIINKIIDLSLQAGAKIAEAGEFTKRSFLNGKISIDQAESVSSLIHAKSDLGVRLSANNLHGKLGRSLRKIKNKLIKIIAALEFNLDISEEDLMPQFIPDLIDFIVELEKQIKQSIEYFETTKILTQGASVVIVGPPNAGKSTLFNKLSKSNKAIVTNIPGTTRDVLENHINLSGISLVIKDTAGIRKTTNRVELEGLARAKKEIKNSDITICLGSKEENKKLKKSKTIFVFNKIDKNRPIGNYDLNISALKGTNMKDLTSLISEKLINSNQQQPEVIITSKRQKNHLETALKLIKNAHKNLINSLGLEVVASDLYLVLKNLDSITTITEKDEILNSVFSQFCVGK